ISGATLQLSGASICCGDIPAEVSPYVNNVAQRATPIAAPVRAVVVFIPEAVPTLFRGTEPKIALWFGELKSAHPRPDNIKGMTMRGINESRLRDARKNCAITIRPEPAVQSGRDPSRSDNQPAKGATSTIMTELAMMIQPICEGE